MDISFSGELPCISAATSAGASSCSQEDNMFFYSVPTSPKTSSIYAFVLDQDEFEFEFETSHRFIDPCDLEADMSKEEDDDDEKQKRRLQRKSEDSLRTMAFADELFCDGKVLPLGLPPLKLPPRLQNRSGRELITPSSMVSLSSRSFGSSMRLPFSGQSLWNDDFDPFMVALEVVRGEGRRGKSKGRDGIRRTRSVSPFRGKGPNRSSSEGHCRPCELQCEGPKEPLIPTSRSPKIMLCEPKGLVFARRVRQVGVGKNGPNRLNRSKEERESGGAWTRKGEREKIMEFLFGKASGQHKLKDQKDEPVKKMTITSYKPRLLLCLGYGGKYVK